MNTHISSFRLVCKQRLHLLRLAQWRRVLALWLAVVIGMGPLPLIQVQAQSQSASNGDQFLVVDCLLPPQMRKLGTQMTFLTARRAVRATASECEIRGGEYVAYDRANLDTALKVWLPLAEKGDAQAMTYVGEMYQKGLGVTPDMRRAAEWYRKAAELGFARAQINYGYLLEQGLGVQKDVRQALSWYQKAQGGVTPLGVEAPAMPPAAAQESAETTQLKRELAATQAELARLKDELAKLKAEQKKPAAQSALESRELVVKALSERETQLSQKLQSATTAAAGDAGSSAPPSIHVIEPSMVLTRGTQTVKVRAGVSRKEVSGKVFAPAGIAKFTVNGGDRRIDKSGTFIVDIPLNQSGTTITLTATDTLGRSASHTLTLVAADDAGASPEPPAQSVAVSGRKLALVIGNNNYRSLQKLDTAVADAKAVADVLKKRYGFEVTLLTDVNRFQALSALNELVKKVKEEDRVFVYYAGHGELDRVNVRGHWQPIDAEKNNPVNWISSIQVTDLLNVMAARQILVVADSCYSGALTRTSLGTLVRGTSDDNEQLKRLAQGRTRTALTSGGLKPVMDGGGDGHSVFARALLDVLQAAPSAVTGVQIHREIAARVERAAKDAGINQTPEYAPILYAGHEAGDFVLAPVSAPRVTGAVREPLLERAVLAQQ